MASAAVAPHADVLNQIFQGLRSKSSETRLQSALDLRRYVCTKVAELPSDQAMKLWDDSINKRIFELIHATSVTDKLGGVQAIDHLLDLDGDEGLESKRNLYRFFNYVKSLLPDPDINVMLAASKTLGQIAEIGGPGFGERFMEKEVPYAIGLLQGDKQEPGRYAGVLILKELARNSPAYFHAHIDLVFDKLLIPLRDARLIVREGAAELLAACLEIITQRERTAPNAHMARILRDAQAGLKMPQAEVLHGSLLTYRELLLHGGMFMRETFLDTGEQILRFKTARDALVRKMVITLIPTLATYDTQTFAEHFLHHAMAHLLTQLDKPPERAIAFIAIGHVATAVNSDMKPFLESIMAHIKTGLQARNSKKAAAAQQTSEEPMFQCVGMLASAVGPNLTKLLHDQLELMFACGLSDPLRQALVAIAGHIPPLLKTIQDRLLDMLSHILTGHGYRPLGAPPPLPGSSEAQVNGVQKENRTELLVLALDTLGSFDFSGHALAEFVRDAALQYLDSDEPALRRAAALTCCRVFARDSICYQASSHSIEVIFDVLDKLLTAGIADPEPSIRAAVLGGLHETFDRHLAQAENVRSLFIALNDECFENRLLAVGLIGRLAAHNPAYVMPSLRKALVQLLTELEYAPAPRAREECTHLLTQLVAATARLIKPYALPMLRVLLGKASDSNPTVAANVLMCLGELAVVGGEDVRPHVPELMEIVLGKLNDSASGKRDAALRTLGQVCAATGYVIEPLVEHPELLPALGRLLRAEGGQGGSGAVVGAGGGLRREVVKVLGTLGALDPYRRRGGRPDDLTTPDPAPASAAAPGALAYASSSASDDYYQAVVIHALLAILKDTALQTHHHIVIEAIMSIFKTQGLKCVTFLPDIVPAFCTVARTANGARIQEFHLQQLAILVGIIRQHVRNYMPDVFKLVTDLWDASAGALQLPLVGLVEALGRALDAEFKPFLPAVLPLMLRVFDDTPAHHQSSAPSSGMSADKRTQAQMKVFDALLSFGANIEEYLHLVIPIVVRTYERSDAPLALRKRAVLTIDGLAARVNFSEHASRIIHPLVRVLNNPYPGSSTGSSTSGANASATTTGATPNGPGAGGGPAANELRAAVLDTLCALVMQLGSDYAIFVPTVDKVLRRTRFGSAKYDGLISKLLNGERMPQELGALEYIMSESAKAPEFSAPAEAAKMQVNQQHLKQAWDTSSIGSREDWLEWMHRLSVEFMKESPSHALRACMGLVDIHPPLARELFNAAFISCWRELYEQYQEDLVRAIEFAITSDTTPSELVHRLLNLCEFMEHEDQRLPIENSTLGAIAERYHAYAKALHYKELEFFAESSPAIIEALISVNTRLQQQDAAWGTLSIAREQYDVSKHEEWYERLGRWNDALVVYERRAQQDPDAGFDVVLGRMKCLHALGEWDALSAQVEDTWSGAGADERREIAPMAAAAAWSLNDWDSMDSYIASMRADSADKSFYRAILSVHQNQFPKALTHITRARDLLDPEFGGLVGEAYGRSYNTMVRAQMLSELEEIIQYKQFADQPERQGTMRRTWMKRLQGCQPDVEVWQRILQVRTLVLSPDDDPVMWIKFANLCRKNDRMPLAEKTINSLLSPERNQRAPPNVVYAQLKFMWAEGAKSESLTFLRQFVTSLARDLQPEVPTQRGGVPKQKMAELSHLLARCFFKQGQWQMEVEDNWGARNVKDILHSYFLATHYDPLWYKAWHTWAMTNFEVVGYMSERNLDTGGEGLINHIVPAVQGFFRSIALRSENALQDTLRLLTLWFKYGAHDDVSNAMAAGFGTVEVDTWLEVVPQIIARIQTPSANIRRNITNLLTDVGKQHPQALIYPLAVASKSSSISRKSAASAIMDRMKEHSRTIVEQALVVGNELIRVAILWHELWHERLEEASRQYYTEHNPEGMIAALEPLHDMLEAGPTTARETSFAQAFGRELHEAREHTRRYRRYGEIKDLDAAWDIYFAVFKKVEKQLPQLTTLDLQYVSPELLKARNLEIAVPGTYASGKPLVTISSFASKLTVISSKQRPRRISLKGSDGKDYQYLLKGHEDLRQDERVMQFYGLVNTLLAVDTNSFKRKLRIRGYAVIPLGPHAGLIGWVHDSDTLHVLVRDYRESRKVLLNIEYRLMLQMAPDYESLMLLQKIEVFEYALENTTGQDLYRMLWLKSANSEHWLERRATYTRSLAVNSMVGHILGLGDRHPSNLMLERKTGKVVHIDFGDCFEIAMHRDKFPEKIPFRLTRMLTHAMEVSGIEGSFRNTCEISMNVLRDNRESLLAVLEAFVYDPLINWRLMPNIEDKRLAGSDVSRQAELTRVTAYPQGPMRKVKADENEILNEAPESRDGRALAVYRRVEAKLTGRDFNPDLPLTVEQQVEKLIQQATSLENLCQCFSGWCAFW
ncbi:atypical/PIKK/FRAP protein kinase [Peniophora sp. CONT]|nr:atypical/PIKK/FRAP protein kinase [Peniophora sp. CONT]